MELYKWLTKSVFIREVKPGGIYWTETDLAWNLKKVAAMSTSAFFTLIQMLFGRFRLYIYIVFNFWITVKDKLAVQ